MPDTEEHTDILDRLSSDLAQLKRMVDLTKFAGEETGVRVKSPALLVESLSDAIAEIRALRTKLAAETAAYECASDSLGKAREHIAKFKRAVRGGIDAITYLTRNDENPSKFVGIAHARLQQVLDEEGAT